MNGQAETPLNADGLRQARDAGIALSRMDGRFALAGCSTLQRCVDTARAALAQLPYAVPVRYTDDLRERSLGEFEGKFVDEVYAARPEYRDHPDFMHFRMHYAQKAPGGENMTEVTRRAWGAVLALQRAVDGDVVVFSHATTIRCMLGVALDLSEGEAIGLAVPNATPIVLEKLRDRYAHVSGLG